jgi:RES domain-containing protein
MTVASVQERDTHRLVPSKYSEVIWSLTENKAEFDELMELDSATNDRRLGELGLLPGIGIHELVYGVEYAHIVNAAFAHAGPTGGRFNDSERGAWYAGLDRETASDEVGFHLFEQLRETDWDQEEVSTFDDYLADFTTRMYDLREPGLGYEVFLKPGPIPDCYAESQHLAAGLLAEKSNGIIYPSVRHQEGTCIVCFRPALVYNVRQGTHLELRLHPPYSERHKIFLTVKELGGPPEPEV